MKTSKYILQFSNKWGNQQAPVVIVRANATVIQTNRQVKVLSNSGIIERVLIDESTVKYVAMVEKEIELNKVYAGLKIVDLVTKEIFEYKIENLNKENNLLGGYLKTSLNYMKPSFALHLGLASLVGAVLWAPIITGSLFGSESSLNSESSAQVDLVDDRKTSSGSSPIAVPRELWFQGRGFFESERNQTKTSVFSSIAKRFSGFNGFGAKGSGGNSFGLQVASGAQNDRVSQLVANYKEEAPVKSSQSTLTDEQQKRVKSRMRMAESKMISVYDSFRAQSHDFAVSVSYQFKVDNSGRTKPVNVKVEGSGSEESKIQFRAAFERIVSNIEMGNDLSGIIFQGQKVFVN